MLTRRGKATLPTAEDGPATPPSGRPGDPAEAPSRTVWVLDVITLAGGLLLAALGLTVMASWFAMTTAVLRVGSQHPMAFNTALAVAVTGAALVAFTRGRRWPALVAGVFDTVLGIVVLGEYALGRGLGIDQLVVKAYISAPHEISGRPPVITAVCLTLVGAALLAWSPSRSRPQPSALAVAGSFIGGIAIISIVGYATGAPAAYVWLHGTSMAFLTALAMLILAVSLLSAAWRGIPEGHQGWPRWLPVPAGVVAFGLADVVWLAFVGDDIGAGRGAVKDGSTVLGFLTAGLVALAVWLAQQADLRRRMATAEAMRASDSATAAEDTERRLFQFLDAMPVGVFITDASGQPYYANHDAEGLLGRGVIPNVGAVELAETYGAFVAGSDEPYPTERLPVVRALHGESPHISDLEIHHPDGPVIPLEVWGRPMYGASGAVDYGLAVFADMSERNARERVIADLAALLELAHVAILVRDQDSRIVYWNAGAEHIYGFTRAEAIGHTSHEILHTTFPEPLADIEATLTQAGRWEGELLHRCADGRLIVVDSRWVGERGPDGTLQRFMEINRDITSRKEADRELHRGAEEIRELNATLERQVHERTVHLQRSNNNLAAFTYSVAHDLSTPLRALSGYAEILAEEHSDQLDDASIGYVGRIRAASAHMAALIDNLLLLSRVSQTEMNLQEVDLSAEVTAICDQLRAHDPDRRVCLTVEDGVRVVADRGLALIALENLLQNAWKFTAGRDDATIQFATASITSTAAAPICCYVRDNGIGFDFAYADKLFQPFQRLHSPSEFPGVGVGLATVQRIIERHGGRTWAEGAVGLGATFYFTLDAKADGEPERV